MKKIGEFIYPWGNGHYSRMMRLNDAINETVVDEIETHFFSKGEILEKLYKRFPAKKNVLVLDWVLHVMHHTHAKPRKTHVLSNTFCNGRRPNKLPQ
mgnify:CR=1 FL=1